MHSVVDLVTDLSAREHPMLTWYGPADERVDLTGKTAANWMIKAANLLTMELACEPGMTVWLDLPVHWRTLIWAHATWCTGARIMFTGDDADIAVTATPTDAHTHLDTIVIALPALARRVEHLPPDTVDGAADLMTQADNFLLPPAGSPGDLTGLGSTQAELLTTTPPLEAIRSDGVPLEQARVLLTGGSLPATLAAVPAIWAKGASVVISGAASVAESEGVTHTQTLPA